MLLLLATSVLPFPTALLGNAYRDGTHRDQVVALDLYVLVAAASAATWLVLFRYWRPTSGARPGHPASFFVNERRRAVVGIALYVMSALVALWQPFVALAVACALPVFYAATSEGWSLALPGRHPSN